jgi:chemotaxis protein methyltransferase CheR
MGLLPLTPQVFAILSAFIEETAGLSYGLEQADLLADRVTGRALERGLDSLLDYYYLLRYDDPRGEEAQALIEALAVHETFFLRELDAMQGAIEVVAEVVAREGRARVWSAACSTGEEPASLAMLLADRRLLSKVELVATDVSNKALARARAGRHVKRSIRNDARPDLVARWLRHEGDEVVVDATLLAAIRYRRVNLFDDAAVGSLGPFDVILCRNVLIYFRDLRAREVVTRLEGALRPGGALVVGVSESLLRLGSGLNLEEIGGAFVYRKGSR